MSILYFIKPQTGALYRLFTANTDLLKILLNKKIQKLHNIYILRLNFFCQILEFLQISFSFSKKFSPLLNNQVAGLYMRSCYINFVKLYSSSNYSELNQIHKKIVEMNTQLQESVEKK